MKKIIGLSICMLVFLNSMYCQNEFGTVGSYWQYSFEPHSGGSGWTMITIEKDTMINGVEFKKYSWKHHVQIGFYPAEEYSSTGLIRIENDTVFNDENVMIDFTMSLNDSLQLAGLGVDIQLAIDSITTETIDGFDYKKWHGQKICVMGANSSGPYEQFIILESIGQIENGYLFWNIDGCAIGGGINSFVCYNNGSFSYPPGIECEKLLLASNDNHLVANSIDVFPNPVGKELSIRSNNNPIDQIKILSVEGEVVQEFLVEQNEIVLDVSNLTNGVYFLRIAMGKDVEFRKVIVL